MLNGRTRAGCVLSHNCLTGRLGYDSIWQGDQRLGTSKLIYDPNKGRFFEKEIEEICREEYCARDEKTGEPIILSVREKERIFLDCIQSYYYNGRCVLA